MEQTGIDLPETAIDIDTDAEENKTGSTRDVYFDAELENMTYAKTAQQQIVLPDLDPIGQASGRDRSATMIDANQDRTGHQGPMHLICEVVA